jgi:hypothetical protein
MVLGMQPFAAPKPKEPVPSDLENLDPNKVIRDNTVPVKQPPKQVVSSKPVEEDMKRLNTNSSLSHSRGHHDKINI